MLAVLPPANIQTAPTPVQVIGFAPPPAQHTCPTAPHGSPCASPGGHPRRLFPDGGDDGGGQAAAIVRHRASSRDGCPDPEPPRSPAFRPPYPRGPCTGKPCPSPTVVQPAANIEPRPPRQLRPRILVGPLSLLVSLGGRAGCRPARHRGPLAPRRLPPVLAMEVALRQPVRWWRLPGDQTAHPPDGRVQRGLERAQNSRRIAQARHRHRRAKRVPLHAAQATEAALPNLAYLPRQPCRLARGS